MKSERAVGALLILMGVTATAQAQGQWEWHHDPQGPLSGGLQGISDGKLGFFAWCELNAPGTTVIRFNGNHGNIAVGESVALGVQGSAGSVQAKATFDGGNPDFVIETTANAPIWRVLSGSQLVVLSAKGAPLATLGNIDTNAAKAFLAGCTPGGTTQAQVVQPQPQPQPDPSPQRRGPVPGTNDDPAFYTKALQARDDAWTYNANGPLSGTISGKIIKDDWLMFEATCRPDQPGQIAARFYGSLAVLMSGESAIARVEGPGGVAQQRVDWNPQPKILPGSFTAPATAPVWRVLSGGNYFVFTVNGLTLTGATDVDDKMRAFVANCTPGAGANVATQQNGGDNGAAAAAIGALAVGAAAALAGKIADEVFTEAPPPDAPGNGQGRTVNVRVMSVKAIATTFGIGGDEIFLLASNGQRFPPQNNAAKSIDAGQTWSPSAPFSAPGGLSIDLREYDSVTASDLIGNFRIADNVAPGRYTATLRGDGATYEIGYEVAIGGGGGPRVSNNTPRPKVIQPAPRVSRPNRVWSTHNAYSEITVTDCRDDCEEDIGIILACQGPGQPARVDVPWAALDNGQEGQRAPLAIVVDGRRYQYTATLGPYGLVGHVPWFMVAPGDPVIAALQGGSVAQVQFAGSGVNIGLKGSRQALDIFKAHCGWNNQGAAGPAPTGPAAGRRRASRSGTFRTTTTSSAVRSRH